MDVPNYRYIDDAIRKGDTHAIRSMVEIGDPSLIHNIRKVAKYIGEKNMCVDEFLLIHGYEWYNDIGYGAARGGHRDVVMDMMERGEMTLIPLMMKDIRY